MHADLAGQVESLLKEGGQSLPPVHLWNPPLSGDIDIRIAADGSWYHEGTRFERAALARLFASILKREGDEYFLVTPVEKWRLRVDCTPFVATDCDVIGEGGERQLVFSTNVGERVHCSAAHPLQMIDFPAGSGATIPCVAVRSGLLARIERSVYYRLVADCGEFHEGMLRVCSGGQWFALGRLDDPGQAGN